MILCTFLLWLIVLLISERGYWYVFVGDVGVGGGMCARNKSKCLDAFEWFVEFGVYGCE